jgi:conjugal transfer/entry exclusion protein
MKTRRQIISSAVALTLVPYGLTVKAAGIPVIDVANLTENAVTAFEQVANTITAGKQYIEDVKQTLNTFPLIDQLSKSQELAQMIDVIKSAQKLQGALRDAKSTYEYLGSAFASSRYTSLETFLNEIGKRREVGDETAKALYDSAKLAEDQVAKAYDAHMAITAGMPMIEGVTQATQATANSVGVLIQQQQTVLAMMSASTRDLGKERQRQYTERANEEEALKRYKEQLKRDAEHDKKLLNGL